MRTRALQTAIQVEDDFLEFARAFHQMEAASTHPPQTTLENHTINEEIPSGLVGMQPNVSLRMYTIWILE